MDPVPFILKAGEKFGEIGSNMAIELIEDLITYQYRNPWGGLETSDWKNIIDLKDLFESEGLEAFYGKFLDQRYIDFLNRNFDSIDQMHWRKFEQLSAEFLDREGYRVDLGPGRGDDGVDVRAWPKDGAAGTPPAIIVQCKRQKASVEKVVVKSVYADVLHEKATSGLIVTTSRLSPGAAQTADVRHYPIEVADRNTLRNWLEQLHTPGTGVILD